ncbi:MAG: SDR family oxidoreductase [Acidobacteria bacterium]|nr:SDR family oxidoreductase [Acidobacteriota bacterium]
MLLKNKTVVIFAASGAIGSAFARKAAEEGARLYVSARSAEPLRMLAEQLGARHQIVDAMREPEVDSWIDSIVEESGGIDVVLNPIGPRAAEAGYAQPCTTLSFEKFMLPLELIAGSQFLTAKSAVRHMAPRGSGSILMLSASLTGNFIPFMSGITAACGAVEGLARTLAAELGPAGIRVNCVRAGGMPETRTIQETSARMAEAAGSGKEAASRANTAGILRRPLRLTEVAASLVWLASDEASGVAGQVINVCAGTVVSR